MSAISTYLHQIITAIWAKDVRQAIHDAIRQCYDDVNAPALQTEAMQAAVQAKIDAGQMAALTIADGSLTGAKLANGTIPTAKIADGAVTAGKIASGVVPAVDATLTQTGAAADAKATGDAIASIEPGLSESAKTALLNCFAHVAWVDEHGQDYYDALEVALSSSNYPYTKWSTNPPDDTYGRIYVDANKVIGESRPAPNVPYVNNATDRAAIHTDSNYSTYKIRPVSGVNVEYYAMQLPLGATGFTATFGNTSGTCLYVFKRDNNGYYQVVSSYIRWYTDQEIVTGLDPNSLYIVCGASKYNNSNLSVTIEVTTDGNI